MPPSIQDLRADWIRTRDSLRARCEPLGVEDTISSSSQFAAAAWQNRLHAWCRDLDEMPGDYPADRRKPPS